MEYETPQFYIFFKNKVEEARANGAEVIKGTIWNMYRYEYLLLLAKKDGYNIVLKKRDVNDTHHFEMKL